MARTGFLLSPVVGYCVSFGCLAQDGGLAELAGQEVTSMTLSAETASGLSACYAAPLRLRLYRLEFPGQDLSKAQGFGELKSLSKTARRAMVLRGAYPPAPAYSLESGSVLAVPPDSAIQLSVQSQPKQLRLGFGFLLPEGAARPTTGPVLFKVSALDQHGELVPVWSQRLDPAQPEARQRRQPVLVDLSHCQSSELVLETTPEQPMPSDGLRCYWSELGLQ
jgi:hypothetical protein